MSGARERSFKQEVEYWYGELRMLWESDVSTSKMLGIPIVVVIADLVLEATDSALEEAEESNAEKRWKRWFRLVHTTSPLRLTLLQMPTTYPFKRDEQAWPPFTGVRKELGESA